MDRVREQQAAKEVAKREKAYKRCTICSSTLRKLRALEEQLAVAREHARTVGAEQRGTIKRLVERCQALESQIDALLARLGEPRRDPVRERLFKQGRGR